MELNEIMELFEKHEAQEYARGFDVGKEYGYKKGYKDGYNQGFVYKDSYQRGLDDAWECAKKICANWVISDEALAEIFGKGETIDDIMLNYSATEAIAKIKEYEQKQTKHDKCCKSCKYETLTEEEAPCINCGNMYESFTNWMPKETADEIKAEYDEETRAYSYTMGNEAEYPKRLFTVENFRKVCNALLRITESECSDYGFCEACDIADEYMEQIEEKSNEQR